MREEGSTSTLEVTEAEGGQKLMQFLLRRLSLPQTLLHRWVRTGQIRRNGGRCKPFDHVQAGDMVRLPPFAPDMHRAALEDKARRNGPTADAPPSTPAPAPVPALVPAKRTEPGAQAGQAALPPLVYVSGMDGERAAAASAPAPASHLLVLNKPAGLPVHPGTGHSDSIATRLAAHHADAPFRPAPAHRLDKDTSGLLLAASSYSTLRALQDAFRDRRMVKEYVAWVHGHWAGDEPVLLRHHLAKKYVGSDEKMRVLGGPAEYSKTPYLASPLDSASSARPAGSPAFEADEDKEGKDGKEAVCIVCCLRREADSLASPHSAHAGTRSLLHIRLVTGRTHQIRAQLAAVGHPLCGDFKYGAPAETPSPAARGTAAHRARPAPRTLYLHSLRIILPDVPELAHLPHEFAVLPPWRGRQALRELPPPLTIPGA